MIQMEGQLWQDVFDIKNNVNFRASATRTEPGTNAYADANQGVGATTDADPSSPVLMLTHQAGSVTCTRRPTNSRIETVPGSLTVPVARDTVASMPNAEIVSIGSELLLGQIVDTNSAWMAQRLTDLGIDLFHTSVVGDNRSRMAEVIGRARGRADVVICGGGLGPTQDDLTREEIAEVTGRELVRDQALVASI